MVNETYWLIEWPQHPEPLTVLHPNAEWLSRAVHEWTVESVRVERWTNDASEAVHFPSKEDAEAIIKWLWGPEKQIYIATEHMDGVIASMDPVVGHKTFHSPERGTWHEPLRKAEADALWEQSEREKEKRASEMPDEKAAINHMWDGYYRLKELGWAEAIYCPKDGSMFLCIEAGSTGVFDCNYTGEWPDGYWNVYADGDMYPSRPILWKPKP